MSTPTTTAGHRPATVRIAHWSATHPWRAIGMWLAFVIACIAIGQVAGLHEMSDLDGTVGQSGHAARMIHDAHLDSPDEEDVLISARNGSLDIATAQRAAADVGAALSTLPSVTHVAAPVRSEDGTALLVAATLNTGTDDATPLLDATAAVQKQYPQLRVEESGSVSMDQAVNDQVGSDLGAAATFSLPVTIVILLIAFGAIVAAGVPVLLALSAVGSATGLASLVSHFIPDSGSTSSMILLMGMAVGVDYSLFYVKRARAERHRGHTHLDAIEIAAETSGHSVLVSGVAVIAAMLGMFFAHYAVFSSLAAGSIIVVAVAVLGSLTVLPAVLVKLGRRIDRPRVPVLWRWSMSDHEPGGTSRSRGSLWPALLRPALNRPGRTLIVSVLAMGALALPALSLHLQSDTLASLPNSIAEKHTAVRINEAFPRETTGHDIVVEAPAAAADVVRTRLDALAHRLDGNTLYVPGSAELRASTDHTVHVLEVATPHDPESTAAKQSLELLRDTMVPTALRGVPGVDWAVGGDTAESLDLDRHLGDAIGWVIGFVVLLTLLIMGWVFRSAVIALTTAAVNLLSAGVAFGVLTLVFQHSWAEGLLDFHSTGGVVNWIPLFTFAVLFGLSMDYHVFVLGHVREAAARGLDTRRAVREGLTRSAGTVTSAALVMVSVFAIFAVLHMVEMKELGLTLAVAVLVDALVVRIVVLPSLLCLLGARTWWPGRVPGGSSGLGEGHGAVDLGAVVEQPHLRHAGVG